MILSGSGRNFTIPGKNIKVSLSQAFDRKDLSGSGSGSDFASSGNKPKELSVATTVPESDEAQLRQLMAIAEAMEPSGDPVIYTVADRLCQLLNIRKVIFSGTIRVQESDRLRAWDVSFTLTDAASTAAKREERARQEQLAKEGNQDGVIKIDIGNPETISGRINL